MLFISIDIDAQDYLRINEMAKDLGLKWKRQLLMNYIKLSHEDAVAFKKT